MEGDDGMSELRGIHDSDALWVGVGMCMVIEREAAV